MDSPARIPPSSRAPHNLHRHGEAVCQREPRTISTVIASPEGAWRSRKLTAPALPRVRCTAGTLVPGPSGGWMAGPGWAPTLTWTSRGPWLARQRTRSAWDRLAEVSADP